MKTILLLLLLLCCVQCFATNYYVSPSGSNSNSGLTPALAKQTLTGTSSITSVITSGSTCYIAPGRYQEKYIFGATNETLQADPLNLQGFPGVASGNVRITEAASGTEIPGAATPAVSSTYSGDALQGYRVNGVPYFIIVDGTTGVGVEGSSSNYIACNYVTVQCVGGQGFFYCTCAYCLSALNNYFEPYNICNATNCIAISGVYSTITNTICYSGNGNTFTNDIAIGGTIGFYSSGTSGATCINDIAQGCEYGFDDSVAANPMTITNCCARFCQYSFTGNATTALNIGTCYTLNGGAGTNTTGTATASGGIILDPAQIFRAFEPLSSVGIYQLGTATGAPSTDIWGRSLTSPPTLGPWGGMTASSRYWSSNVPVWMRAY